MSVVIVGGNERMVCQYENICKGYGCCKRKRYYEKENRSAGSSDSFYKHSISQNGQLCGGRGKEKIYPRMQMPYQQCVCAGKYHEGILRVNGGCSLRLRQPDRNAFRIIFGGVILPCMFRDSGIFMPRRLAGSLHVNSDGR